MKATPTDKRGAGRSKFVVRRDMIGTFGTELRMAGEIDEGFAAEAGENSVLDIVVLMGMIAV